MQASRHSAMVSHIAGIYNKVSAKYIMKSLTEWNRITDSAGKSKGSIAAGRQKVRELCIEAESGIKQLLESEEDKFLANNQLMPSVSKKLPTE